MQPQEHQQQQMIRVPGTGMMMGQQQCGQTPMIMQGLVL